MTSTIDTSIEVLGTDDLKDLDETYDVQAEVSSPADGTYTVKITDCVVTRTPKSNSRAVRLQMVISASESGKFINSPVTQYLLIETAENQKYTKPTLVKLGYRGPISQIPMNLAHFIGLEIESELVTTANRRTGRPFQNVQFGKVLPRN